MKRIISFVLILITVLSLTACTDTKPSSSSDSTTETTGVATETIAETTEEVTTEAETTVPETTLPETTVPETTVPVTTAPVTTAPVTTAPVTTAPVTTVPETTAPAPQVFYPKAFMYHCIHDVPYTDITSLFVRPSEFESHCQVIQEMGLTTLFADEFGPRNDKAVILTFDDGYEDNYTYMFPIIKKYNIKVTIFMIAYKIDQPNYLKTEQIQEMVASGLVQFGSHTYDHPMLATLSNLDIYYQLIEAKAILKEVTGQSINALAYPSGSYNSSVTWITSQYHSFAYTTKDDEYTNQSYVTLPRYGVPRGMSKESFRNHLYW